MTEPVDRRANDGLVLLVQLVHDTQLAMQADQKALDEKLTKHMTDETHELAQEIAKLMSDAFPEGDPAGHKKYHEASIKHAEARAEFWEKMRYEIAKYGLIGFLVWAGGYLWMGFLQGPHK